MGKQFVRKSRSSIEKINMRYFDYKLFGIIILLAITGLFFLYSASSAYAYSTKNDMLYYFKKQAIWVIFASLLMITITFVNLENIRKYMPYIMLVTIFLLIITLFMPKIQNTRRWIPLKIMNLQTSEIAKIVFVLYISDYIDRNFSKIKNLKYLIKPILVVSIILILIAIEPDLGTPALIFVVMISVLFVSGINLLYILIPLAVGVLLIISEIIRHPYRLARIKTFLSPWDDPTGKSFQLVQSLVAIGSGWWFGRGPGNSIINLNYLPESHTDFIFPVVAEETGFIGVCIIMILFFSFFKRTLHIALHAKDTFLFYVAFTSGFMITVQAFFNIAMTGGMVPTKGLPLPFFSYGGSSIVSTMILCGFILNVSLRRKGI